MDWIRLAPSVCEWLLRRAALHRQTTDSARGRNPRELKDAKFSSLTFCAPFGRNAVLNGMSTNK